MVNKPTILFVLAFTAIGMAGSGGYRSPFAIGFGARELGMGGATVANIKSAGSIFWNPAGLAITDRSEMQLFHMSLFMDTHYNAVAVAMPTATFGTFGMGVGDLSSGDFDRIENYLTIGGFSSHQELLMAGFGLPLSKRFYTGLTVKGVYYDMAGYRDSGFGFDLGLIYDFAYIEGLSFGLKGSDIGGPSIKLGTLEQRFPSALRGGLAYDRSIANKHSFTVNFDIEQTEMIGTELFAGAELGLNHLLYLRAGYMTDRFTCGAGMTYSGLKFDYAFTAVSDMGNSHRLSLGYAFGKSIKNRQKPGESGNLGNTVIKYKILTKQAKPGEIEQELAKAEGFEREGKIYEAIQSYYRVLEMDIHNRRALKRAAVLIRLNRELLVRGAHGVFTRRFLRAQLDLGDNYYDLDQYESSKNHYNLVLLLDPENIRARDRLAAIAKLGEAQPEDARAEIQAQIDRGDFGSALGLVNKILAVDPEDADALTSREYIKKHIESSHYLDEALKYVDRGAYGKAKASVDTALALTPDYEPASTLLHQLTGIPTTLEDIKSDTEHWKIYIEATGKYRAGNYEEAILLWQSLQQYYPNNLNLKRNVDQASGELKKEQR